MQAWSSSALKAANVLLVLTIVGELGWFVWTQQRPVIPAGAGAPHGGPSAGSGEESSAEPVASVAAAATHTLFQSASTDATAGDAVAPEASANENAAVYRSRLTLIGVVDGEPPQAIIEDAEGKKTSFVSVGQQVAGGPVVEAITKNRVTLNLNGAKIELSL